MLKEKRYKRTLWLPARTIDILEKTSLAASPAGQPGKSTSDIAVVAVDKLHTDLIKIAEAEKAKEKKDKRNAARRAKDKANKAAKKDSDDATLTSPAPTQDSKPLPAT